MSTPPTVPADKIALYEQLIETIPELTRKGATTPYTSLNGHMFSFLTESGMALRLPKSVRDKFIEKYETQLCEQNGHVMKEYVEVPDSLLIKTNKLKKFFKASFDYVSGLKPKATIGKKVKKKVAGTGALKKKK